MFNTKKCSVYFLAFMILVFSFYNTTMDTSIISAENRAIQEKQRILKKQLEEKNKEVNKKKVEYAEADEKYNKADNQFQQEVRKVEEIRDEQKTLKNERDKLEVTIMKNKREMQAIVRDIYYEGGAVAVVIFALTQANIASFGNDDMGAYLGYLSAKYTKLYKSNIAAKSSLEEKEKKLEQTKANLEDALVVLSDARKNLEKEAAAKKIVLDREKLQQGSIEAELKKYEKLMQEERARIVAAAAAAAAASAANNTGTNKANSVPPKVSSGGYICPTRGIITSEFGAMEKGVRSWPHEGIDIGAPMGTPVYAAKAGVVVIDSRASSPLYGIFCTIRHEDGVITHYAHMSGRVVSPGQWVEQGQLIGYVGSTGFSTGPHLHFGVMVNGAWQNPRNYVNFG